MSLALRFKSSAIALTAAAVFSSVAANGAHALDLEPGQCLPAAEMMSRLKAEGQKSVIVADRVWVDRNNQIAGRKFNVFTSNVDGSKGYNIEGNAPMGSPSSEFCLGSDYTDVSLYNSKGQTLPPSILPNSHLASAIQAGIARNHQSPMMVAHRNGAILVISGNPDNKTNINGALLVGNNDVNKKAGILNLFANVDYSQNVVRDKLPSTDLLLGH